MSERKSGLGSYHGSASDRGSADRYYFRAKDPHFWPEGTDKGTRVEAVDMTAEELAAYAVAFREETDRKDFGGKEPEPQAHDDE